MIQHIYFFPSPLIADLILVKFDIFLGQLQLRIWSQPDMVNQTLYALDFATKAYEYFTDFFQIPDVVPKAGLYLKIRSLDINTLANRKQIMLKKF